MSKPTTSFLKFCQISGLSLEEAEKSWLVLWEKTINDFLNWLVKEANLNQAQAEKIYQMLVDLLHDKIKKKSILDLVCPFFKKEQQDLAVKNYARIFNQNLDEFYLNLSKKMTLAQKQVAKAYLEIESKNERD